MRQDDKAHLIRFPLQERALVAPAILGSYLLAFIYLHSKSIPFHSLCYQLCSRL
jgi:hypothetical protein